MILFTGSDEESLTAEKNKEKSSHKSDVGVCKLTEYLIFG